MKKIIIAILPLLLFGTACKKNFENQNPKLFTTVPAASLFTQSQRVLTNTLTSTNVNLNVFRLVVQHWEETTYTDEANYDFATRAIPDAVWNAFYRDVLNNLRLCKENLATDATITSEDVRKNDVAIADILSVYTWYYLLTTYGDIPYSQAFDAANTFPKYDDAATVYNDLLTRLDADIAAINPAAGSFSAAADVVYGGSSAKWVKFANTLKLKMGITIVKSDPAKAKSVIEAAAPGVFTSNADNAKFQYLSSPPNTNPLWVDIIQSGRNDFGASKTLVDRLKALADPRLSKYFSPLANGQYVGAVPGAGSGFENLSHINPTITAPTFPGALLDYSETEFNLAEAAGRGFNVGGTAATHYANAVTASVTFWGGTAADAATYLANPAVAYATATGTLDEKIGVQKWIALYNRGFDAWIEVRRLDYPALTPPKNAESGFPNRLTYPVNEANINGVSNSAAAAAIGGDVVETKLFFDK
jgi:hypothetical protein